MIRRKRLVLLGSTGSIGRSTLDVVARYPERFVVEGLVANRSVALLQQQIKKFKPAWVALSDPAAARALQATMRNWKNQPRLLIGLEGIRRIAILPRVNMVLSAMVGAVGLLPTLDAIRHGKDIALANKETLVMAGELVMHAVAKYKVRLLPVDSEHAALAQCLKGHPTSPVKRLILTASGGPFARWTATRLKRAKAQDALKHPTWSMGPKITIDSSTLMNKGLEIIEAHHLFHVPYEQIEVTVHPQSIVHSMVEYSDGSTLAQMSNPDMRLPIQMALTEPEKVGQIVRPLDFQSGMQLSFQAPDRKKFPCLDLAYRAGRLGGVAPAVLNAANEVAVEAFLAGRLSFYGIPKVIAQVLQQHQPQHCPSLEKILTADQWARDAAKEEIACKY